jgi:hypothetical protein
MDDRIGRIEAGIEEVLQRLQSLDDRVSKLEGAYVPAETQADRPPVAFAVPPVIQRPTPPTAPKGSGTQSDSAAPAWDLSSPRPGTDTEYRLGAQILPRVGAVMIVLALLYLVAIGIARGVITPAMQFAGELLLSAGFIGLGFLKQNEREEFGELLIGVGSCGLYLSFAGAHVYKGLITGEALVGLYILLGLANLAFSTFRASKAFFAIGLVGGVAGAVLPIREGAVDLSLMLQSLVLGAAGIVAAARGWPGGSLAVYLNGLAISWYLAAGHETTVLRLAMLYALPSIGLASHVFAQARSGLTARRVLPVVGPLVVAVGTQLASQDLAIPVWLHVLLFAVALGALGSGLARVGESMKRPAELLLLGGVVVVGVGVPVALPENAGTSALYALFSLAALAGWQVTRRPSFRVLAVVELVLGALFYGLVADGDPQPRGEIGLLALLIVAGAWAANAHGRSSDESSPEAAAITSPSIANPWLALLSGILFVRLGVVLQLALLPASTPILGGLWGALVCAAVLAAGAVVRGWVPGAALAWFKISVALWIYAASTDRTPPIFLETVELLAMLAAVAWATTASTRHSAERSTPLLLGGALFGALFSRAGYVILTGSPLQVHPSAAISISWTVLAMGFLATGFWKGHRELRYLGFLAFGLTLAKVVLYDAMELSEGLRVLVFLALGLAMVAGGYLYIRLRAGAESRT